MTAKKLPLKVLKLTLLKNIYRVRSYCKWATNNLCLKRCFDAKVTSLKIKNAESLGDGTSWKLFIMPVKNNVLLSNHWLIKWYTGLPLVI